MLLRSLPQQLVNKTLGRYILEMGKAAVLMTSFLNLPAMNSCMTNEFGLPKPKPNHFLAEFLSKRPAMPINHLSYSSNLKKIMNFK